MRAGAPGADGAAYHPTARASGSASVSTAHTPGILRALPTSIFLTMAFGCGQRRMAAYSIFGRLTSAGKTAVPLTRS